MNQIAVFPGSFDPFTLGHQHIAERALFFCSKLVVAIGVNDLKKPMFDADERCRRVQEVFANEKRIETAVYSGLTVDFCRQIGAKIIIRGIRGIADCHQEILTAQANLLLDPSIETLFLLALPADAAISSSAVREALAHNGSTQCFLPKLNLPER